MPRRCSRAVAWATASGSTSPRSDSGSALEASVNRVSPTGSGGPGHRGQQIQCHWMIDGKAIEGHGPGHSHRHRVSAAGRGRRRAPRTGPRARGRCRGSGRYRPAGRWPARAPTADRPPRPRLDPPRPRPPRHEVSQQGDRFVGNTATPTTEATERHCRLREVISTWPGPFGRNGFKPRGSSALSNTTSHRARTASSAAAPPPPPRPPHPGRPAAARTRARTIGPGSGSGPPHGPTRQCRNGPGNDGRTRWRCSNCRPHPSGQR